MHNARPGQNHATQPVALTADAGTYKGLHGNVGPLSFCYYLATKLIPIAIGSVRQVNPAQKLSGQNPGFVIMWEERVARCYPNLERGNKMRKLYRAPMSAAFAIAMVATAIFPTTPALAGNNKKEVTIPHCVRPLGTAAVHIPTDTQDGWSALGLSSPETVVKSLVQESGCFTLLDRGQAFQIAEQERALATGGQLRAGSNIGKGQMRAADYVIVPSMMAQNGNAGGVNVGGIAGGLISGVFGTLVSGLNIHKKTADVHLEVVNVRTSEVAASADGHAKKSDVSFGGGAGGASWTGFGAFGASSYVNTDMGRVFMSAYVDAFIQVVQQQHGVLDLPADASSTAPPAPDPVSVPEQTGLTVTRQSSFRSGPSTKSAITRTLSPGSRVYPTGEKSGNWLQATTEDGAQGWVSSLSLRSN